MDSGESPKPDSSRQPVTGEIPARTVAADPDGTAAAGVQPLDVGAVGTLNPRVFVDDQPALRVKQRPGDFRPVKRRREGVSTVGPSDLVRFAGVDSVVVRVDGPSGLLRRTPEYLGEFLDSFGPLVRPEFDRAVEVVELAFEAFEDALVEDLVAEFVRLPDDVDRKLRIPGRFVPEPFAVFITRMPPFITTAYVDRAPVPLTTVACP